MFTYKLGCIETPKFRNYPKNESVYKLKPSNFMYLHINVSSVVAFQRWWVLKSKLFPQESTSSKEILIRTTLNHLWFSVVSQNQSFLSWLSCSYIIFGAKFEFSGTNWVEKTPISIFSTFGSKFERKKLEKNEKIQKT